MNTKKAIKGGFLYVVRWKDPEDKLSKKNINLYVYLVLMHKTIILASVLISEIPKIVTCIPIFYQQ